MSDEKDQNPLLNNPIEYDREKRLPELSRNVDSILWVLVSVLSLGFALYMMYYSYTRYVNRGHHTVLALGWGILVFLAIDALGTDRETMRGKLSLATNAILAVATVAVTYYFFTNFEAIRGSVLTYSQLEYVFGGILVVVIVEATRRAYGNVLTVVVLVTIGYALFGNYLPGWFTHSGIDSQRMVEISVLTLGGVYGNIVEVGVTWVAIFLIYAGLLEGYGALNMAFALGQVVEKRVRAGTAQAAVLASLFMGSISGSAVANTATTGSFTIPLMKERGFRGETAAGIESTASSGGQVIPPVMGAAAFVMAGILNIPYVDIIAIALLPAILFYMTISISTHILSLKQGLAEESAIFDDDGDNVFEQLPGKEVLVHGIPILVSLLVLIYYLAWVRFDPMTSALRSMIALVALQFLWQFYLSGFETHSLVLTGKKTLQGLQIGAVTAGPIFVVLGSIGIIVEMIGVGTFTQILTFAMLDASGGSLLVLLFFAMVMSLMFGLGMPTVAAYVLVAIFVGPAVVEFGIEQMYAHMFVFYFAILSAITPPVALTCVVACKIADVGFFKTCKEALKIAFPAFLLPYAFIIHPNLLQWNSMTLLTFVLVAVGLIGLIVAINGYFVTHASAVSRGVVGVGSLSIIFVNEPVLNVGAAVLVVSVMAKNYRSHTSQPVAAGD